MLARNLGPCRRASLVPTLDRGLLLVGLEEHPPAVVGHLYVVVVGPATTLHGDSRAQVDRHVLEIRGAHVVPPLEVVGKPTLESPAELGVVGEPNVVGDLRSQVNGRYAHEFTPRLCPS